jgi:hypothetical protein
MSSQLTLYSFVGQTTLHDCQLLQRYADVLCARTQDDDVVLQAQGETEILGIRIHKISKDP